MLTRAAVNMPSRRDWWQLKLSRFSSRYRAQLLQAAVCLFGYLRAENLPDASDIMRRTRFADTVLLGFVQHICKSPVPRSLHLAKHALLFCQAVWPRLRHHLPESWAAIRSLQDMKAERSAYPSASSACSVYGHCRSCSRPSGGGCKS